MLNTLQVLLAVAIAFLYALAYTLGHRHMRAALAAAESAQPPQSSSAPSMGFQARLLVLLATVLIAVLLVWRSVSQGNAALAYLDSFLVLALLLSFALIYLRLTRHLSGLSFYIVPMIVIVLLLGVALEFLRPGPFPYYEKAWTLVHIAAIITGSLCFALACVGGIVYLAAAKRLKSKKMGPAPGSRFPPLASLEKFNRWTVYIGFFLLTVAIVTGSLSILHGGAQQPKAKLIFALAAWIIYALLLPRAPSFRGKRSAWLSIVGFFLILGGYVAATWIK